ncbi:18298_t:CDS:2 [Gigaspora margarita]|uniref:18298_t:CDS:1 n=1 Tax=Gigaspora margarita TaxID=4874 RepID=A0ABN7WRH6_GIGMA|nr:18298_t:CDS:2 [Gigaspora margarita]
MKINDEARQLKNNRPNGPERTDSYAKSGSEKNNEPKSSSASSEQIIPATICKEKISLGGSENSIDIDKLLSSVLTCSIAFSINHNYMVSHCEKATEFGEHHAKRKSQISCPQKIYK